jgi:membrane peptidoglycan carboxypeptidase
MISAGYLDEARAATVGMPQTVRYDPRAVSAGLAKPTGLVVSHVLSEMRQSEPFKNTSWDQFRNGGYAVVTTVDARAQALLEATADDTVAGSVMSDEPTNLQAAAVVVQPGTGRVLAYYGGHSGTGADFAGWYYDADGVPTGYGAHPAGPTFQVYALAAALRGGISVRSWWDARSPKEFPPERVGKLAVRNTGSCPTGRTACTLADSTLASLNTPYYALTERLGPAKVIEMAHAVGIDYIWTDADPAKRSRIDLGAKPASELVPQPFATEVGLGQYPVTVLDQANGMATLAANRRARAHFVWSVSKGGQVLHAEQLPRDAQPVLNQAQSADLTWTLGRTAAGKLKGRDSASKTGSWPLGASATDTAHAWIVGFTGELAMAVWIGNDGEEKAIEDVNGKAVTGSTLPALIYRTFMTGAYSRLAIKATTKFRKPTYVGDDTAGNVRPPA